MLEGVTGMFEREVEEEAEEDAIDVSHVGSDTIKIKDKMLCCALCLEWLTRDDIYRVNCFS